GAEMLKIIRWCFMGLCLAFANAHALPVLLVDAGTGKLLGADGVNVGGTLYDVRFVDGTCINVFSGCDSLADFAFTTLAAVAVAAQALLDQVFLDVSAGNFDTDPTLTQGCTFPFSCVPLAPFAFVGMPTQVLAAGRFNANTVDDNVGGLSQPLAPS